MGAYETVIYNRLYRPMAFDRRDVVGRASIEQRETCAVLVYTYCIRVSFRKVAKGGQNHTYEKGGGGGWVKGNACNNVFSGVGACFPIKFLNLQVIPLHDLNTYIRILSGITFFFQDRWRLPPLD